MPDVHITWLQGRTVDQKRKIAERIMQMLSEEAGAKPEATHLILCSRIFLLRIFPLAEFPSRTSSANP